MSNPEIFGGEEGANEYELGTLYAHTTMWLEANSQLFLEQIDNISGTYDGLPITQHSPRFEFEIPGNILRRVLPSASEYFDDDDTLCFMYLIPHYTAMQTYEFDDDEAVKYQYRKPQCSFDIEKANEPRYGVSVTIECASDEDTWQVHRFLHADLDGDQEIRENPEVMPFVDPKQFESNNPISRLTSKEYNLFSAIVSKLDEIKSMMPEPPLYVPEGLR